MRIHLVLPGPFEHQEDLLSVVTVSAQGSMSLELVQEGLGRLSMAFGRTCLLGTPLHTPAVSAALASRLVFVVDFEERTGALLEGWERERPNRPLGKGVVV